MEYKQMRSGLYAALLVMPIALTGCKTTQGDIGPILGGGIGAVIGKKVTGNSDLGTGVGAVIGVILGKELTGGLEDKTNTPNQRQKFETVWVTNSNGTRFRFDLYNVDGKYWKDTNGQVYDNFPKPHELKERYQIN